jgi:hypothetical protein
MTRDAAGAPSSPAAVVPTNTQREEPGNRWVEDCRRTRHVELVSRCDQPMRLGSMASGVMEGPGEVRASGDIRPSPEQQAVSPSRVVPAAIGAAPRASNISPEPSKNKPVVCRARFRGVPCGGALRPMRLDPTFYYHVVTPTFRHSPLPYRVPHSFIPESTLKGTP